MSWLHHGRVHHAYRRRFPRGPSLGNLFGWGVAGLVACALVGWWIGADPISLVVLLGAWLVFMLALMKR
jgi:hypothetical protein